MKKIILSLLVVFLAFPATVFASPTQNFDDFVVVGPNETIDGDFIAAGERVDIHGTVLGDVYVAGGMVNIDGVVEGDVLVAGGEVTIAGEVMQDLRAVAGSVSITGTVQRNITVFGGSVDISRSAQVNRNVYVAAGSFFMAGSIDGDLFYASDPDYQISETASISGTVTRNETDYSVNEKQVQNATKSINLFAKFISILSTILLGFLVIKFLPRYADRASELVKTSFWKSFLTGFVAMIVLPILIIISFVTLIGFPIGIILFALFVVYMFVARIYVMIALGKKVEEWTNVTIKGEYYHFGVGVFAYYLLTLIPVVGEFIKFFVIMAGFGAALRNIRNTYYIGVGKKIF